MDNIEAFIIEFIRLHPYGSFAFIIVGFLVVCIVGSILTAPEIKEHE